jgi:hypothetical protein
MRHAELAGILPGFATAQKPLDITGAAVIHPHLFTSAIEMWSGT